LPEFPTIEFEDRARKPPFRKSLQDAIASVAVWKSVMNAMYNVMDLSYK